MEGCVCVCERGRGEDRHAVGRVVVEKSVGRTDVLDIERIGGDHTHRGHSRGGCEHGTGEAGGGPK